MEDLMGRVAGDLCGTRLALVEELLRYAKRKEPEHVGQGNADEPIVVSSDSEVEL